jgi:hypothetical protein
MRWCGVAPKVAGPRYRATFRDGNFEAPAQPALNLLEIMRHALMYAGGFERNRPKLTNSSTSFEGSDGDSHAYPAWPAEADGLRISFMEKAGKKFVAVRVADDMSDVVLPNEQILIPGEHFGFNTRLSGTPVVIDDNIAIMKLLEDIIKKNHDTADELLKIRARFKASASTKEHP